MPPKILKRNVYSFEKAMWHEITEPCFEKLGAVQVMKNRFDNVTIRLAQAGYFLEEDGEFIPNEGAYAILRSPMEGETKPVPLGTCTDRFHPIQPMEVAETFDQYVKQYVETMAFLGNGEDMFISWELPAVYVPNEDPLKMYAIIRIGFDGKHGGRLYSAAVRPVCWNTITMAQGWADAHSGGNKLVGNMWRGRNTDKSLKEHMGIWMEHLQENAQRESSVLSEFFNKLTLVPVRGVSEVKAILESAFPFKGFNADKTPVKLHEKTMKEVEEYNQTQEMVRNTILNLFDGQGTAITPDLWGVLNATTEAVCHYMPSKKPIANSVMFGDRASITGRVVSVLKTLV